MNVDSLCCDVRISCTPQNAYAAQCNAMLPAMIHVIVQLPLYSRSCMLHPIDIVHQGQGGKRSNRVSISVVWVSRPIVLCAAISAHASSVLHRAHFASSCI